MTSLKITKDNVDRYRNGSFPDITKITWRIQGELHRDVLKCFPDLTHFNCCDNQLTSLQGIESCTALQELYCDYNQLTTLQGIESCTTLQILHCYNNQLTLLQGIESCTTLQILYCYNNQLTSLQGIESCTALQKLYCSDNRLTSLQGIESCTALQGLDCSNNQFTSLQGIDSCTALRELRCSFNKLTSLQGIDSCTALRELDCSFNQLTSLQGIESRTALQGLDCGFNRLTSLQNIVYLRHLRKFYCSGNLIENPSIQVQRFLRRLRNVKQKTTVYEDNQNVHDVTIQASTKNSLANLMNGPSIDFDITTVLQSGLSESSKNAITEYCSDNSIHSYFLVTYQELFSRVWNRIINNEHRDELIQILDEQIQDAECKCMTGRFVRTMSVLVGFYDDITIGISDNSQIAAVIETTRKRTIPYDAHRHANVVHQQLIEMGYEESFIRPWIEAILEDN